MAHQVPWILMPLVMSLDVSVSIGMPTALGKPNCLSK
jgi:hypothetical protein